MTPEYQFWMKVLQEPKSTAAQQQPQTIGSKLLLPSYDTQLTPEEESQFQTWKAQHAPNDSGEDYDLRGAFKAGVTPDPQTGHWSDRFKKPNHPTFSNESIYAIGDDAAKAGKWVGSTFVPPFKPAFDPSREAGPDNPLPRAIYHPKSGAFLGYAPTIVDRGVAPTGNVKVPQEPETVVPRGPGWGERGDQPNPIIQLGKRLITDATESIQDMKEEPEELLYRLRERERAYGLRRQR